MRVEDTRPFDEMERTLELCQVLSRLWTYSITTKSDEARIYADQIAEAASRGFITTAIAPHGTLFGRLWKLTPSGLSYLFNYAGDPRIQETAYVENHQG
jgi:hypothetical protein